jgi:hypothetical protein
MGATTLSIMTFSITIEKNATLNIATLGITALGTRYCYTECHKLCIMLYVVMLSVIAPFMLIVGMPVFHW